MCGRYNIASDTQALMDAFDVFEADTSIVVADRYNIAPSEPPPEGESTRERRMTRVPTIRVNGNRRVMRSAIWPLIPVWARGIVPQVHYRERAFRNNGEATGVPTRLGVGPALYGAGELIRRVAGGRG